MQEKGEQIVEEKKMHGRELFQVPGWVQRKQLQAPQITVLPY